MRVLIQLQRGKQFVGDGNFSADNKVQARKTNDPSPRRIGEAKPLGSERPAICIAMAQQSGEFGRGNQSAPQKLLQLVGCREPKRSARAMDPPPRRTR